MAIDTQITRRLDNNTVQVEVKAGNMPVRYYKVPENQADSFQREYKQGSKKMTWTTTGLVLLGGFLGMTPAYLLSKKLTKSPAIRSIINVATGFAGCLAGSLIGNKMGVKSHQAMLEKYNAEEFELHQTKLPI